MTEDQDDPVGARASSLAADLRVLVGRLKRRLREESDLGDLSWPQVSVLGHLERGGPSTVTMLARAEGVRPQSMGATVADLEAAGLVSGAPHPTDGRQTIFTLTPACRVWINTSRAARQDWLSRAIQTNLTLKEQDHLAVGVELLKRLIDP